jgi:hypothetical protein
MLATMSNPVFSIADFNGDGKLDISVTCFDLLP